MARATRSKPAPKSSPPQEPTESTKKSLPASVSNPPKLFVLPKDASKNARIVTLDNPSNGEPSRYYFCPEKGFYEFTRIAAPKKECRSWLIAGNKSAAGEDEKSESDKKEEDVSIGSGYTTKSADLFIATPIDLLFLLLPALAPKNTKEAKQLFLAFDDHLDNLSSSSRHWKALLAQYPSLKSMVEIKMRILCDSVDAGDETMYRISNEKLLAALLKKAERMCKNGLPPSMEEKFIKSALDVPVMNIKREESSISAMTENKEPQGSQTSDTTQPTITDSQTPVTTATDSQATTDSVSTSATSLAVEEEVPSKPALETPPEVPHLLRLRTCITYLTSSYLPSAYRATISSLLASTSSSINFAPLETHLAAVAKLKAEAAALRSISDNISRKRNFEDDDEKAAEREEKKRRKEEDERKKKTESRGIKQLKKADTSGMKKLSSFFTKAAKKA